MRITKLAVRAVVVLALVLAGAYLVVLAIVPLAKGWVPLTVLSGSMEPTIPIGSQVVVERVQGEDDAEQVQVGDVVTFMPYPDDPTLVTHRIMARSVNTDGITFSTKGDANDAEDPWEVTEVQLRGKVLYHVPYAGYIADLLSPEQKERGRQVAGGALLLYAAVVTVRPLVRRLRHQGDGRGSAAKTAA